MTDILDSGDADFLAMARPFIREPDLVRKLEAGRTGGVACVLCNMCLAHEGFAPLRCGRDSPRAVTVHIRKHYWTNRRKGHSPHKCGNPAGKPACEEDASWAPNHLANTGALAGRHRTFPRESPALGQYFT